MDEDVVCTPWTEEIRDAWGELRAAADNFRKMLYKPESEGFLGDIVVVFHEQHMHPDHELPCDGYGLLVAEDASPHLVCGLLATGMDFL